MNIYWLLVASIGQFQLEIFQMWQIYGVAEIVLNINEETDKTISTETSSLGNLIK